MVVEREGGGLGGRGKGKCRIYRHFYWDYGKFGDVMGYCNRKGA